MTTLNCLNYLCVFPLKSSFKDFSLSNGRAKTLFVLLPLIGSKLEERLEALALIKFVTGRVILSGYAQEVTWILLSGQCENHGVTALVNVGLL